MKIGLVRHFPLHQPFLKGWVTQTEVLQWFDEYSMAPVQKMHLDLTADWHGCFTSQLPRAVATANTIFSGTIVQTEMLNEPHPRAIFQTNIKMPFLLWDMVLRWAIKRNHPSQPHGKMLIEKHIQVLLQRLFYEEKNVLIVIHAITMEILSDYLIKHGFKGKKLSNPKNGILYLYEKKIN